MRWRCCYALDIRWLPGFTRQASTLEDFEFGTMTISDWSVVLPLWLPSAILFLPVAFFWWRDRRRRSPTACRSCGYDLTGNVSGVCPECGVACEIQGVSGGEGGEGTGGNGGNRDAVVEKGRRRSRDRLKVTEGRR